MGGLLAGGRAIGYVGPIQNYWGGGGGPPCPPPSSYAFDLPMSSDVSYYLRLNTISSRMRVQNPTINLVVFKVSKKQ